MDHYRIDWKLQNCKLKILVIHSFLLWIYFLSRLCEIILVEKIFCDSNFLLYYLTYHIRQIYPALFSDLEEPDLTHRASTIPEVFEKSARCRSIFVKANFNFKDNGKEESIQEGSKEVFKKENLNSSIFSRNIPISHRGVFCLPILPTHSVVAKLLARRRFTEGGSIPSVARDYLAVQRFASMIRGKHILYGHANVILISSQTITR